MALGTLLERLFIAISADLSGLTSGVDKGVAAVDAAALELNRSWARVSDTFDDVGITAARNFQMITREAREMSQAMQGYAAAQGYAFSSIHRNLNNVDRFGRSLGQARSQLTNLGFQLNDIGVSLASGMNPLLILVQQGSQIQQIYSGGQGGIAALFKDLGGLAVRLAPVAIVVGAIAGGFALLQREINKTAEVQVSFMDTIQATMKVLWERIAGFFKPIAEFFGPILSAIMDGAVWLFKETMNALVKLVQLAILDFGFYWNNFPKMVSAAVVAATNFVIDGLNMMTGAAIAAVNGLIGLLKQIPGIQLDFLAEDTGAIPKMTQDLSELNAALEDYARREAEILASDPMGDLFNDIKIEAVEIAMARIAEGTEDIGSAAEKAGDKIKDNIVTPLMKAADNLAGIFGNAFEEIAETGKFTFGNFINDLNNLLISSVSDSLQKNLSTMFQGIFAGSGGTGGGNILGDIFTSIFGGFKAGGGVVMPWKSFVAGERGAELINRDGPGGASRVTPAGRTKSLLGGGAGGAPVSVVFNMPPGTDMSSFRKSEGQIASKIARAVDRGRRNQ